MSTALVALVLVGCGKKEGSGEPAKDESATAAQPTAGNESGEPKTAEPEPPAPTMEAGGACPSGTALTALESNKDLSAAGPFELPKFSHAVAETKKDGTEVSVYVSNREWTIDRYNQLPSPVDTTGDAYLKLTFYSHDGPVTNRSFGENPHTEEETSYVGVSLFVKDQSLGVSLGESKAEILNITDSQVCGTFSLHGKDEVDGRKTHFEGTFVAPLPAN